MTGYVRQRDAQISSGSVIYAADIKAELDQVQTAYNATAGHRHNGTTGEGAPITVVGPVQDVTISTTAVLPKTDDTVGIGSALLRFKDAFFSGVITALTFVGNLTGNVTGNLTGNADTVTNGVYTVGNQTVAGVKTFSSTIVGGVSGNAGTVTNGVYTSGNQTIADVKTFTTSPDLVGIRSGGSAIATLTGTSARFLVPVVTTSGGYTSPNIVNAIGDNTGIVIPASGTTVGFSINGIERFEVDGSGAKINGQQAYYRGNIVGGVTESAGVPTGAVVERGSNADGEYIRYADGTQICWKNTIASPVASTASGPIYTNAAGELWVFPLAFSTPPTVTASTSGASSSTRWANVYSIVSTQAGIRVFSTISSAANVPVNAIAIGRWF